MRVGEIWTQRLQILHKIVQDTQTFSAQLVMTFRKKVIFRSTLFHSRPRDYSQLRLPLKPLEQANALRYREFKHHSTIVSNVISFDTIARWPMTHPSILQCCDAYEHHNTIVSRGFKGGPQLGPRVEVRTTEVRHTEEAFLNLLNPNQI